MSLEGVRQVTLNSRKQASGSGAVCVSCYDFQPVGISLATGADCDAVATHEDERINAGDKSQDVCLSLIGLVASPSGGSGTPKEAEHVVLVHGLCLNSRTTDRPRNSASHHGAQTGSSRYHKAAGGEADQT